MNRRHSFELTVPVTDADHSIGPADAPVKLLLRRFTGRLRFVYRHFPLEEVHPHAISAAEAAECAGAQGRFWPMHDLLFENQAYLKLHQLRDYAEQLQLDMARYTFEMNDHVYLQRIREHMQNGLESGVRSTPTFFVKGKLQDVSFGLSALFSAVEAIPQGSPIGGPFDLVREW